MKAVLVLCIAFAIAFPAQGLLLDTIQNLVNSGVNTVQNVVSSGVNTVQNVVNSGVNTVNNVVSSVNNAVDIAQFVGQFLWDNSLGPSWEMFLSGGADFIDNYFGNILNAVGKKRETEVRLQLALVQAAFQQQAAELVTYFKSLLNTFIAEAMQIAQNSILNILFGQTTINDVVGVILQKFKLYITQGVQHAIQQFTTSVQGLGPEAAQAVSFVQQQLTMAGVMFENELNQISSFAINAVNGGLAFLYNNFEDLISYYKLKVNEFISDANKLIGAALIGLLFGATSVEAVLASIIAKGQEYLVTMIQYTVVYAQEKLTGLYNQYKPLIQQVLNFVQSVNLNNINISQLQNLAQQVLGPLSIMMPLPPFETINQLLG